MDLVALTSTADLYSAGMTSHASEMVMLGLEAEFDAEFPDQCSSEACSRVSNRSASRSRAYGAVAVVTG